MEKGRVIRAETWDVMQFFFSEFNDHQIHCVIRPGNRIDENRLMQACRLLSEEFPLLLSRFAVRHGVPRWESTQLSPDSMVSIVSADDPEAVTDRLICRRNDESSGPQLHVFLVRGAARDVLCFVINHMLCDAAGLKELLYRLCDIYSRLKTKPNLYPAPKALPRDARQVLSALGRRRRFRLFFHRYSLSRHDDSIVFPLAGDRNAPFLAVHTIPEQRFLAAKKFAAAYGATVNDLILTAYLRALQKILPGKSTSIQCIVDLRKYLPDPHAKRFCNLTSNLACDIGPDIGSGFAETLLRVKAVMDEEKQRDNCLHLVSLLEFTFRVIPYPLLKGAVLKAYRNPPLAMSNIGILDRRRLMFDGVPAQSAFMSGSIKYSPYFQLAVSTYRNEVTLSTAFHGTPEDRTAIERFLCMVEEELPGR